MTPDTRTALEKIRKFIEYARYELKPGPPVVGTQFPTQVCADRELTRIDALLSTSPGEPEPNEDHGIECGFIGDPKQPDIYIELPDSCGDVMSEEDEYGKSD